jgi:shikimate dehydrogenase
MTIEATTMLVGLIGHPVSHSLSPRMQNAAFAARGLDWAYVPLDVVEARLPAAAAGLVALGFAGANVTIPHKTPIVGLCDELDEVARRSGSVNTVVVRDGRLLGSSTDGLAVVDSTEPDAAHVLLLGAGGGARAAATALLDAGAASLTVAARRRDAAEALAGQLAHLERGSVHTADWPPDPAAATLLVNATPLRDESPIEPAGHQQVVDLAYRPDGTPTALVAAARKAGCRIVVDGLEVLVRQGAASYERWTGLEAPVEVMRAALGF